MKYCIEITADTGDGDYISNRFDIALEDLPFFEKVSKIIKKEGNNWVTSGYGSEPKSMYKNKLSQEEIEEFDDGVPQGEHGVHTITKIKLLKVEEEVSLL